MGFSKRWMNLMVVPTMILLIISLSSCLNDSTSNRDQPPQSQSENVEVIDNVEEAVKPTEADEVDSENDEYRDFMGYYLHFDSSNRSHSDMFLTIGNDYLSMGWWMSDFVLYEIVEPSIHENILTIEYFLSYQGDEEHGTMDLTYADENGEEKISLDTGEEFFKVSFAEMEKYGYIIQDVIVEDMK